MWIIVLLIRLHEFCAVRLTYFVFRWHTAYKPDARKLNKLQRKALRIMCSTLHGTLSNHVKWNWGIVLLLYEDIWRVTNSHCTKHSFRTNWQDNQQLQNHVKRCSVNCTHPSRTQHMHGNETVKVESVLGCSCRMSSLHLDILNAPTWSEKL